MDAAVSGTVRISFGDGRAPGGEQHWNVAPGGVDHPADRVGRAGYCMHHHHLRSPGDHRKPVGHAHGGNFVGHWNRPRHGLFLIHPFGVRFDNGCKVGAAVAEEVLDTPGGQQLKVRLRHAVHAGMCRHISSRALECPVISTPASTRAPGLTWRMSHYTKFGWTFSLNNRRQFSCNSSGICRPKLISYTI